MVSSDTFFDLKRENIAINEKESDIRIRSYQKEELLEKEHREEKQRKLTMGIPECKRNL